MRSFSSKLQTSKGWTLLEMMLCVGVMGLVMYSARVGLNLVSTLSYHQRLIELRREAEVNIYSISKEIRNCQSIVRVSSDTLVLAAFNRKLGFDARQSAIFDPVNIGTITFHYQAANGQTFIQQTEEFSASPTNRNILINMVQSPDDNNPLFAAYPPGATLPYQGVEISLNMKPNPITHTPLIYKAQAVKRTL